MGQKNSCRFFANRECEYFPCHPGADPERFNCLPPVRPGGGLRGELPLSGQRHQGLLRLPGPPQGGRLRLHHPKIPQTGGAGPAQDRLSPGGGAIDPILPPAETARGGFFVTNRGGEHRIRQPETVNLTGRGGGFMGIVVVRSPRCLRGLLRRLFGIK